MSEAWPSRNQQSDKQHAEEHNIIFNVACGNAKADAVSRSVRHAHPTVEQPTSIGNMGLDRYAYNKKSTQANIPMTIFASSAVVKKLTVIHILFSIPTFKPQANCLLLSSPAAFMFLMLVSQQPRLIAYDNMP